MMTMGPRVGGHFTRFFPLERLVTPLAQEAYVCRMRITDRSGTRARRCRLTFVRPPSGQRCRWFLHILPGLCLIPFGPASAPGNPSTYPAESSLEKISTLQPSEEAITLLRQAEEGIQRADWKLAIDSLQRIVELPGEQVLTSDGQLYESARRYAQRRLASLPPDAVKAYRMLYDGEASALLNRAIATHDKNDLQTIVHQFLIASCGDEAAVTLADWLIDEGMFDQAVMVLEYMSALYPDSDLPNWVIATRLAVCAASRGRTDQASALLNPFEKHRQDLPDEVAERIQLIRAYVSNRPGTRSVKTPRQWLMASGGPARNGQLPPVNPSFPAWRSWRIPLPASDSLVSIAALADYARENQLLPSRQIVTNGDVLIVKGEQELVCVEAASFSPLWISRTPAAIEDTSIVGTGTKRRTSAVRIISHESAWTGSQPIVHHLLYDSVGGSMAIIDDMVLTIHWTADPPEPPERPLPNKKRWSVATSPDPDSYPNEIVAYSLQDGSILFRSDISNLSSDQKSGHTIGQPQFLSTPLLVEGLLVAPCRIKNDLYLVAMEPATGKYVRHLYLCGIASARFDALHALAPCWADGLLFIPTNAGLLFAIEPTGWTIQWAVRYQKIDEVKPAGWFPTPVIAASDVVLLAPGDADSLFCIERNSGRIRWTIARTEYSFERSDHSQVIAATDEQVTLAGNEVHQIDLTSGHLKWRAICPPITGRGVLCDDRVYIPTTDGLIAFDAQSGDPIAVSQPVKQEPLGNLFSWDGALYSVGIHDVRKFPDLETGYANTRAAYLADRANPFVAMKLACLEMAQHHPRLALAALADTPDSLRDSDPRKYRILTHLRIEAMQELANSGETSADESLELLKKAKAIAASQSDRIQTVLALGDHYREQGNALAACQQYVSIMLSSDGDAMVVEEPGLRQRARNLANQRQSDLLDRLTETEAQTISGQLHQRDESNNSEEQQKSLRWLTESSAMGESAVEATLQLGIIAAKNLRFEYAEMLYLDVLRLATSNRLRAEAAARLAAIYLEPDELHQPVSAIALLKQLETESPDTLLPAHLARARPDDDLLTLTNSDTDLLPAATVAKRLRERIDIEIISRHRAALNPIPLGPPRSPHPSRINRGDPLHLPGDRTEPLADIYLSLAEGERLEAQRATDDDLLWPALLRLPQEPAVQMDNENQGGLFVVGTGGRLFAQGADGHVVAAVDGQILLINNPRSLHAIGLLTGRRLWSRRFGSPLNIGTIATTSPTWIQAHDGYVATMSGDGRLQVARSCDGQRILWERNDPRSRWRSLRICGPYIAAINDTLETAHVFRLTDGRSVGTCHFKQDKRAIDIVMSEGVICGPASSHEIAAFDLSVPGTERWRVSMPEPLSDIFRPAPGLIGISDDSGQLEVVKAATGRRHLTATLYACEGGIDHATLIDGVLYVCGQQTRSEPGRASFPARWVLAAIRENDGTILWQRADFEKYLYMSEELLRVSSNAIPVVTLNLRTTSQPHDVATPRAVALGEEIALSIVDKATGKTIGPRVSARSRSTNELSNLLRGRPVASKEVQVWPGMVLVRIGKELIRFPIAPPKSEQESPSLSGETK